MITISERIAQVKHVLSTPHAKIEYSKYSTDYLIQLKFFLNTDYTNYLSCDGFENKICIGNFIIYKDNNEFIKSGQKSIPLLNLCVAACWNSSSKERRKKLTECFVTIAGFDIDYPIDNLPVELAALFILK